MEKSSHIIRAFPSRQRLGIIALGLALLTALLLVFALVGLFSARVNEEQRAAISRVTRIVPEMNGYRIYWSGSTALDMVSAYDVQVRELPDGGWRDWKMGTTETTAWFGPAEGKSFAFRVRGYDGAGHAEPWPAEASMTTENLRE